MGTVSGAIRSVIDLGTNTVLMVTGRCLPDGSVEVLDDAHAIARMGQGVDAERRIRPDAMERVCGFLEEYRNRAHGLGASSIRAYGTSALRDAANKGEFIARVRKKVGIELRELPGNEEARLTFIGAAFGLSLPPRYGVIDIGGGSTELALGVGNEVEKSVSVDMGAVRLTERHFPHLPPSPEQLEAAREVIDYSLNQFFPFPSRITLVGVAGTVTTLGAIDRGIEQFNADALNGHFLETSRIAELSSLLLSLPHQEICSIPQINEQRADIISAGTLILLLALQKWKCPGLYVSTRGIRYGLLLRELES
jgi:exopolyphosphatase / guanosine-5'-triphosphate,3'-diphosphate pyrophosphatase